MACGSLLLQDPSGAFWILSADITGDPLTSKTTLTNLIFTAPTINSPSSTWQLSAGLDGGIIATQIAPAGAVTSYALSSSTSNGITFSLTIQDDGILVSTFSTIGFTIVVPWPNNVRMSVWPQSIGLTSTLAGASPLVVSADFSIWSCTLNRFINEDTTNIIVVLDE